MKLDKEETEILDYFESSNKKAAKQNLDKYNEIAKNTVEKKSKISIRLNEKDLKKVKSKAIEIGVPYQSLINMIIHQYVEDKISISL